MKNVLRAVCVLGLALGNMPAQAAAVFNGDVAGFVGGKILNKDDWSPADQQLQYGGQIDWQPAHWPVALSFAYYGSNGSGDVDDPSVGPSKFKGTTEEYQVGVKKFWPAGGAGSAYLGGGVLYGRGKAELTSKTGSFTPVSSSDNGVGGWISGGYLFAFGQHFSLGAELRYSYYEVTLFDTPSTPGGAKASAGGASIGGLLAYRW